MMITPPVAAAQAGQATGGGLLDTFKNAISGATGAAPTQTADAGPKGDGSVGLFDGVLKKALFGGAAGAAIGFIPFLPGGPVLGGIVGALGGAAMGLFSNWRTMQSIKKENEAMLAAMGVQVQHPEVQQILQSGNVSQLLPLMQQAQQTEVAQGTPVTQTAATVSQTDLAAAQQQGIAQGEVPAVVDPATAGISQSPIPAQGTVAVGSGAAGGAINPNAAVNPGVAPALAQGGGGSAGDVGRPVAPIGASGTDAAAVAGPQPGIGSNTTGASEAAAGVDALHVDPATLKHDEVLKLIEVLQQQIDRLKTLLAEQDRTAARDQAELQGVAAEAARAEAA